ncbi:zinc finger protein 37-like [Musca vetustissima]|uniref:zinc finger protein 37-like n=1 Tax=Musca vetustissima TaxID=27455 RepID=UPI002AB655DF|nr:zinc finger protein 37-like [Musca vetustissima]
MKKFSLHLEKEHERQINSNGLVVAEEDHNKSEHLGDADSLYLSEIKVEDCMVDVKLENDEVEEFNVVTTRNTEKIESQQSYDDPLKTSTIEEVTLPTSENQQRDNEILGDEKQTVLQSSLENENDYDKDDIEMHEFSDDNINHNSDLSADENYSSSDFDDESEDESKNTNRTKTENIQTQSKVDDDDKVFIIALIEAFKNTPQIWDTTHPQKCNSLKEKIEYYKNITDSLNLQFNDENRTVEQVKKKISGLCKEYEKEIDRSMCPRNKREKSQLWFFENMEFLRRSIENKVQIKRKKYRQKVKPLSNHLMEDLIDIYKNYQTLWDVNHMAFTIKDKRNETLKTMAEEIKTKMNLTMDIYKLEKHLSHLHKSYSKDKHKRLECEKTEKEFQPSCGYYSKCDFLDSNQGPFCCPTCKEIVETYNDFQIHRSNHDGSPPFKCQECGMGFKKISNFTIHAKRHLRVFKFICKICGKGYPFNAELELHMRSHTGAQPYLCSFCGESFRTAISYDNHIRRHEERFKYFCHICKKGFNHLTRMNDHVKAHLNVRDIICAVCGKGFTSRKYLNHHKRIHEGKNYICNICGKGFAQDAGLRAHKKYHGTPIGVSSIQKEQNKYNLLS